VRKAVEGDLRAFERLYRRHTARVFTLSRRLLGPGRAEDATQEIFLRAWTRLHTFRQEAPFGAWLARLARNHLLGALRGRLPAWAELGAAQGAVEPEHPAGQPGRDPAGALIRGLDLEAAIDGLPGGARQVLVLRDLEGYTHTEIAEALGISIGTSKSQLHRARVLLRRTLAQGDDTHEL
jgi:RNA polymerase sigma-70 factor (ECF subfamily)